MTTVPPRRGGFTLVELLTVMAVLGILMAIGAAAYLAATGGQRRSNTEATLQKLDVLLMKRYSVLVEEARAEVKKGTAPAALMTVCDNDKERAAAVWAYLKLKTGLPTTQLEATTDASFSATVGMSTFTVTHPKLGIFASGLSASGTEADQSATCLFLAITKGGAGGLTADLDGLQANIGEGPAGSVFLDGYGKPIAFARMAFQTELNSPPYAPPGTTTNLDPLDPGGRLGKPATNWDTAKGPFWTAVAANQLNLGIPGTYSGSQRWTPTLISGGPNGKLGAAADMLGAGGDDGIDNVVSYRLRAGQKGD